MKRATAAIVQHENKILIAQRTKDLFWEFPGGKIDAGETPAQCVIREMKEELDMNIQIERELGVLEGTYRGNLMQVYAFLATWDRRPLIHRVHKDIKWVEPKELKKYSLVEEDQVILEKFFPVN